MTVKEQLRPIRAVALRSLLIEKARKKEVSYYSDWMYFFEVDRFEITKILDDVIELDVQMDTPMVSSLVVKRDSSETGFAQKVGIPQEDMRQRCYEFYAST
jgi:hypothetical protein